MVKYLDLQKINALHAPQIGEAMQRVLNSGWYLQGEENRAFEAEYAAFTGTRHCVGCANGLDALTLILKGYMTMGKLSPGDEVIVPANTYIASILAVSRCGLRPVLVEPNPLTLQIDSARIEQAISPRTRVVMIVHLYGRCAMDSRIAELCARRKLILMEDNAQAHGCLWRGRRTGSISDAAAHSFYPGKNLGALGDAGAVTTDDEALAATIRSLANYGSSRKYIFPYRGINSRLDEVQAAVLRVKLRYLDAENARRCEVASLYRKLINNPKVTLPSEAPEGENVYHVFPILAEGRDELQAYLAGRGVQTLIHYPVAPHLQECYAGEWPGISLPVSESIHARELSLPISPVITDEEASTVASLVNGWK